MREFAQTQKPAPRASFAHPARSKSIRIQPKLKIGAAGDAYEQEADRVADQVMRMPEPQLQKKCACGGGCPSCQSVQDTHEHVQTKSAQSNDAGETAAPPIVHEVLNSPGQPLDPATRAFFEPRFGRDFSDVRVHTDARAAEAASSLNAKAFTLSRSIVFGASKYAPNSDPGRRLLSHELTHVVQQYGGAAVLQRAENDTTQGCDQLGDSQSDIDKLVNAALASSRKTAGSPPNGAKVAEGVEVVLGTNTEVGRSAIEIWAGLLGAKKAFQPPQNTTKYAGVTYRLWSNPTFLILNPTIKVNGFCIGSDKLGHFFQQGWTFHETEAASSRADAEEESERSEGGGYGLQSTGVFSNADREANRQGGKFYQELIKTPTMKFAIANYVSAQWSEVQNPSFYEEGVGKQVWTNLLSGAWKGESKDDDAAPKPLWVHLKASTTGTFLGGFASQPVLPGTITNGTIRYDTTQVRGEVPMVANTAPTPISGIHLEFTWRLGTESGKGFLDSKGEQKLVGRRGQGSSSTNLGSWEINRA